MFPFWFYIEWSKQKFNNLQAWILGPDIEQCPTENRVMFDESCFTTDTIVQREIKEFISYRRLKTQKHSVRKGLSRSWFFFMNIALDNSRCSFLYFKPSDFIRILYCFLPCVGQLPLWKHFIWHHVKLTT